MAALTSIALGVSTAAGIGQVVTARRNAREQRERLRRQETAAREAAKLDTRRDDTGADVELGSQDITEGDAVAAPVQQERRKRSGQILGGVGNSARVGL
jgi:hypothetical protein